MGFGLVALLVAGVLSAFASASPDGLDAVTQRGCTTIDDTGTLAGDCLARQARDHTLAGGPLADYTVQGDQRLSGVAGVVGVLVTLGVAGGLFQLLRRRAPGRENPSS